MPKSRSSKKVKPGQFPVQMARKESKADFVLRLWDENIGRFLTEVEHIASKGGVHVLDEVLRRALGLMGMGEDFTQLRQDIFFGASALEDNDGLLRNPVMFMCVFNTATMESGDLPDTASIQIAGVEMVPGWYSFREAMAMGPVDARILTSQLLQGFCDFPRSLPGSRVAFAFGLAALIPEYENDEDENSFITEMIYQEHVGFSKVWQDDAFRSRALHLFGPVGVGKHLGEDSESVQDYMNDFTVNIESIYCLLSKVMDKASICITEVGTADDETGQRDGFKTLVQAISSDGEMLADDIFFMPTGQVTMLLGEPDRLLEAMDLLKLSPDDIDEMVSHSNEGKLVRDNGDMDVRSAMPLSRLLH